jgi:hypothetical protein
MPPISGHRATAVARHNQLETCQLNLERTNIAPNMLYISTITRYLT